VFARRAQLTLPDGHVRIREFSKAKPRLVLRARQSAVNIHSAAREGDTDG